MLSATARRMFASVESLVATLTRSPRRSLLQSGGKGAGEPTRFITNNHYLGGSARPPR